MADDEIDERLAKLAAESTELADAINRLVGHRATGTVLGAIAQLMANYFASFRGENRKERRKIFDETIDKLIEARFAPKFISGEDFEVVLGSGVQAQIDKDPEMAAFVRDMNARIRQTLDGVDVRDAADVDRRMSALGGMKTVNEDDEDLPEEVRAAIAAAKRKPS